MKLELCSTATRATAVLAACVIGSTLFVAVATGLTGESASSVYASASAKLPPRGA